MNETKTHTIDGVTYREVDRKAEAGDLVVVVDTTTAHEFAIGDVVEVLDVEENDVAAKDMAGVRWYMYHEDYVVLDPVELSGPPPVDMVESPPHYNAGRFEVIDIIAEVTKGYEDPFVGYNVGNTQKYIARAPYKGKLVEDLRKAKRYLEYAIDHIEAEEQKEAR